MGAWSPEVVVWTDGRKNSVLFEGARGAKNIMGAPGMPPDQPGPKPVRMRLPLDPQTRMILKREVTADAEVYGSVVSCVYVGLDLGVLGDSNSSVTLRGNISGYCAISFADAERGVQQRLIGFPGASVRVRLTSARGVFGAQSFSSPVERAISLAGLFFNPLTASSCLIEAQRVGTLLAEQSVPLPGFKGRTLGIAGIDTRFRNGAKETGLPSWAVILSAPDSPESPEFVRSFVTCAAERRGIGQQELLRIAATAYGDIMAKTRRAEPLPDTLLFSSIFAEGVRDVVSTYQYVTDLIDTNCGGGWDQGSVKPCEFFSASIRSAQGGDCEDKNREGPEIFRGVLRMRFPEDDTLSAACWAVSRCYVPLMVLGEVEDRRTEPADMRAARVPFWGSGGGRSIPQDQYHTPQDPSSRLLHNAHCYSMAISARGCAQLCAQNAYNPDNLVVVDSEVVLDPWDKGLPPLLIDGTMGAAELYPRAWNRHGGPPPALDSLDGGGNWWITSTLDSAYYWTIRNVYVPYGLKAARTGAPVYEVFFYSDGEQGKCHGAMLQDIYRLPHAPHPDAPFLPPPPGRPERIWIAATCTPTVDEVHKLAPLVNTMEPVSAYPALCDICSHCASELHLAVRKALPRAKPLHLADLHGTMRRAVISLRLSDFKNGDLDRLSEQLREREGVAYAVREVVSGEPVVHFHMIVN